MTRYGGPEPVTKRKMIFLGSGIPLVALLAILVWASVQTGGRAVSVGVNNEFGEIIVQANAAPEFDLELLTGGSISLRELRGKVVMVDFWASWCPPCRQEAPDLAQVYLEYQDKPVEFVGVDIWDDPGAARDYLEQFQVPYPNGVDAQGTIAIAYGVRGIPEKIFIGPDGTIVKKFIGPIKAEDLREVLDNLLAAQPFP